MTREEHNAYHLEYMRRWRREHPDRYAEHKKKQREYERLKREKAKIDEIQNFMYICFEG